jgi:hypothetical protein
MSHLIQNQSTNAKTKDANWRSLYKIGSVAALIAVAAFLLDIIISLGGKDFNPATLTAIDWFILFQENWLFGLRALGLINVISLAISLSLYFALYAAHRHVYPAYAALALILYVVGTAIYIANNAAIPMFVLSDKFAAVTTDAQRTLLAAAGEAIIARGADFTPGSFIGFFFTEIAGLAFSFIMLRSRIFSRATAYVGILGFTLLSVFTIWSVFVPVLFDVAMLIAMVGGILSIAWYILIARRLFQLGQGTTNAEANQNASMLVGNE